MMRLIRPLAPLVPYIAVAAGLYWLGSAWIAIVSYHALMLLVVVVAPGHRSSAAKRQGVSPLWYLLGFVFALGGLALYVLWPYAFGDALVAGRLASVGINARGWPLFAVYFCCANSLIEEMFWRGCLGQDCRRPVLNDFAFAGYHALVLAWFAGALWLVPVFVGCAFAGWLWRMMRSASGGLAMPVLTHLMADVSIVMAVHLRIFA